MSSSPQDNFRGTPSGVARKTSAISIGASQDEWQSAHLEEEHQREQDLDAARQLSRARGSHGSGHNVGSPQRWMEDDEQKPSSPSHGGMSSIPIRSGAVASAMKQFYQQNNHGSTASVDSQSHFIDHRNQSHSMSMNPNSPLALRASQGASSMRDPSSLSPRARPHGDQSAHMAAPPINLASLGSPSDAQAPIHDDAQSSPDLGQSTHTDTSRATNLEDDVCFPVPSQVDDIAPGPEEPVQVTPERQRPGYPYTFDFEVLEAFADEERHSLGGVQSWPEAPNVGSAPKRHHGTYRGSAMPASVDNGDSTLYSRRPRRPTNGASESGNKFQRKLALFEGGQSFGSSMEPSSRFSQMADATDEPTRPLLKGTSQQTYHGMTNNDKELAGETRHRSRAHSQPDVGRPTPLPHAMADKPYRYTFYSNALPTTIHARYLSELPAKHQSFEELFQGIVPDEDKPQGGQGGTTTPKVPPPPGPLPPGVPTDPARMMESDPTTWWLDVLCPTDQEMKVISRTFGIHPLTTEDILMEETREKIELFRNYYLVCFRSFDQDPYSPTYLEPLNMYIIVFREGTLSFHFRQTPHPQNVRRRIKQLKDYINVTSDWISYALIDDITDAFGPLIQGIEFEVDSIDELVLILKEAEQSDMLRRIGTCRKKVMGLLRLMGNKADVVKGLAKRCNEYWAVAPKSDIGLYLSDIQDHLITMTQNLNHYEMILSRSHSNYLAQISIEMTDANNQINDVLSKLTALGTVIVPMNVITGLWGMNVQVPGQNDLPGQDNLRWFGGICAVMVVIAVSGYITTVRYLERR